MFCFSDNGLAALFRINRVHAFNACDKSVTVIGASTFLELTPRAEINVASSDNKSG